MCKKWAAPPLYKLYWSLKGWFPRLQLIICSGKMAFTSQWKDLTQCVPCIPPLTYLCHLVFLTIYIHLRWHHLMLVGSTYCAGKCYPFIILYFENLFRATDTGYPTGKSTIQEKWLFRAVIARSTNGTMAHFASPPGPSPKASALLYFMIGPAVILHLLQ